jgi:hypothetical protein
LFDLLSRSFLWQRVLLFSMSSYSLSQWCYNCFSELFIVVGQSSRWSNNNSLKGLFFILLSSIILTTHSLKLINTIFFYGFVYCQCFFFYHIIKLIEFIKFSQVNSSSIKIFLFFFFFKCWHRLNIILLY